MEAASKRIEGIAGVHDRSDKDGMEVIIDVKKSHDLDIVLNQFNAHTQVAETSFGIINLAIVGKEPRTMSLFSTISEFVEFRKEIVSKRCNSSSRRQRRGRTYSKGCARPGEHRRDCRIPQGHPGHRRGTGRAHEEVYAQRNAGERGPGHEDIQAGFA